MRRVQAVCFILMLIAAACVTTRPERPVAPGPEAVQMPSIPDMPAPDLSPVSGRRIVLDPGHGGPWPGAVSPANGLREADVNLRVAKRLDAMLTEAGARVIMTRTDDAVPAPDSAAKDLSARAAVGNRENADAFLSVHHNADITGSGRNDLEVFYKLGDDEPSLDLAQCLTYELSQRLRIEAPKKLLLPGNYKVLRESRGTAVLLESSFMTHPGNAAFLATDRAVDAEALAIAAGLARYFKLDPPRIVSAELEDAADGRTPVLAFHFASDKDLDLESARATVDGRNVDGDFDAWSDASRFVFAAPLPNGAHTIGLVVRNKRGASARVDLAANVNRPVAALEVTQYPSSATSATQTMLEVRAFDALGQLVADGTPIGAAGLGSEATKDGVARFYFIPRDAPAQIDVSAGAVHEGVTVTTGTVAHRSLRVLDALTGAPVDGALVKGNRNQGLTTREGWLAYPSHAGAENLSIARDGYETGLASVTAEHTDLKLKPLYNGVVRGKRIAVDPSFGGRSAGAIGPRGTRGSDIALDVARRVTAGLRGAGADVTLTRDGDGELSELQRVAIAEEAGAQLYVAISFGAPDDTARALNDKGLLETGNNAFVGHYPDSANGIRLAQGIAKGLGIAAVRPSVAYVVQQTSCPSVFVQPASLGSRETEDRYLDAATRAATAEAIANAVAAYFGETKPAP